ncbi:hypothetical protein GUJ93_ZPchr0010g8413 [Zizania palustris]|uniref:Uncharacterized protein n=1 Tax=Zizania palustris TaxID=103762 RepID=A0A8J5WE03_ZIZPA|nr:hypothetical protein GUJ93_ZPchr0010g8413 [Zizania palustris]
MQLPLLGDEAPGAMPDVLQPVLPAVPVCSIRHVRQQGGMPMLQQPQEQERHFQVPLKMKMMASFDSIL